MNYVAADSASGSFSFCSSKATFDSRESISHGSSRSTTLSGRKSTDANSPRSIPSFYREQSHVSLATLRRIWMKSHSGAVLELGSSFVELLQRLDGRCPNNGSFGYLSCNILFGLVAKVRDHSDVCNTLSSAGSTMKATMELPVTTSSTHLFFFVEL